MSNQRLIIKRKDSSGTIDLLYNIQPPWGSIVYISFKGKRGGISRQKYVHVTNAKKFGDLLLAVSKIPYNDRELLAQFYKEISFNISNSIDPWVCNADEIAAGLFMIHNLNKLAGGSVLLDTVNKIPGEKV